MAKKLPGPTAALSAAHEDYLRVIYLLSQRGAPATNQAISAELKVTPASATNMVKHLAALNLVTYTRYRGVDLTAAGEKIALAVVRHHRLLELYLAETLGLPWDRVHGEADRLEHAISADLAEAMARVLGEPTIDPHGDPIPARDGTLPSVPVARLAGCEVGARLELARAGAQDSETLRRLGDLGLHPGVEFTLTGRAADGSLVLDVNGDERRLAPALAENLYVRPAGG